MFCARHLKRERFVRLFFVIVAFFGASYLLFVCAFLSMFLFKPFEWLFDSSQSVKQLDIGQNVENSCLDEMRVIIPLPIEIIMNKKKRLWIRSYVLLWVQLLLSIQFRKNNSRLSVKWLQSDYANNILTLFSSTYRFICTLSAVFSFFLSSKMYGTCISATVEF